MSRIRYVNEINELNGEIGKLKGKLDLWNRSIKKVSHNTNLPGPVVEALLKDCLNSDHGGLQKQVTDLLMMTKLIHPENAHKASEAFKAAEAAALKRAKIEKQRAEQYKKAQAEYNAALTKVNLKNSEIDQENLKMAQSIVDAIYEKLKDGVNSSALSDDDRALVERLTTHKSHFKIEKFGLFWTKYRWNGGSLKLANINHPIVTFLMGSRPVQFTKRQSTPKMNSFESMYYYDDFFGDLME